MREVGGIPGHNDSTPVPLERSVNPGTQYAAELGSLLREHRLLPQPVPGRSVFAHHLSALTELDYSGAPPEVLEAATNLIGHLAEQVAVAQAARDAYAADAYVQQPFTSDFFDGADQLLEPVDQPGSAQPELSPVGEGDING